MGLSMGSISLSLVARNATPGLARGRAQKQARAERVPPRQSRKNSIKKHARFHPLIKERAALFFTGPAQDGFLCRLAVKVYS